MLPSSLEPSPAERLQIPRGVIDKENHLGGLEARWQMC